MAVTAVMHEAGAGLRGRLAGGGRVTRHAGALVAAAGRPTAAGGAESGERQERRGGEEHREERGPASRSVWRLFVWHDALLVAGRRRPRRSEDHVPAAAAPRGGNRSGRTVSVILGFAPSGGRKDLCAQGYSGAGRRATGLSGAGKPLLQGVFLAAIERFRHAPQRCES